MSGARNIWTITWLTFDEALRRKMVLAALVLGALFIVLYSLGVHFLLSVTALPLNGASPFSQAITGQANNFLLTMGMYVVNFLTIMLAIFASVDGVSGEISSHTIQSLVTKPVSRWQVILGKWLGYALMILPYMVLLSIGVITSVYAQTGYLPSNIVPALLLLGLEAVVLISLSLLCGTRLSTLTNGVVLFMLYGLAFIGGWIEQFGSILQSRQAIDVGVLSSLLMPVEALWRLVAYLLQPADIQSLPLNRFIPSIFSTGSVPSQNMVIYAVAYAVIMLALAMRSFSRRDL